MPEESWLDSEGMDGVEEGASGDGNSDKKGKKSLTRSSRACLSCRKVKMKCIMSDALSDRCHRCTLGGYDCTFTESLRGRSKKKVVAKVGDRLARLESSLENFARTSAAQALPTLPIPLPPSQLPSTSSSLHVTPLATLPPPSALSIPPAAKVTSPADDPLPTPTLDGFSPNHLFESPPTWEPDAYVDGHHGEQAGQFADDPIKFPMQVKSGESKDVPALLLEKIVDEAEVDGLFEIFYTVCHPQAPFLDPSLHTATWTALHSPFLFTCICTVASRYLSTKRPELYARCRAMAVSLAAKTVFSGLSSVSIVQGCLILAHWNQPGYPSEGDLTYLMSGTAVRMSLELGLHIHKETPTSPTGELDASQLLQGKKNRNRERTWVHCVFTDQSLALQFGKPSMISRESYLMRNLSTWSRHPLAIPSDQAISLIAELHRINTKAIEAFYSDGDSFSGMNERVDHASVIRVYLAQTDNWRSATLGRETATDSGADFRKTWANFLFYHYRVHFLSLGIKLARSKPELAHELTFYALKGYESASALIQLVKEKLGDTCRLRYGMDSTFVYITHSACFLLKLIHPMFSSYIDGIAALAIARDAVSILEKAAVDHFHTPAVYAVFIKTLIGSMGFEDRAALQARSKPSVPLPEFMDAATSQALEPTSADLHQDRAPKFWETMNPATPHMSGTPGGAIMPSPYSYGDMDSWDEPSMGMFSRAGSPQGFGDFVFSAEERDLFPSLLNLD